MDRNEAVVAMVDSTFHREKLLPSEKAFAYKMKMDARKHQGQRTDLTLGQVGIKLRSDEITAQQTGESRNQLQQYIRLRVNTYSENEIRTNYRIKAKNGYFCLRMFNEGAIMKMVCKLSVCLQKG